MLRKILDESQIHPHIRAKIATLHSDIVQEVQTATQQHAAVVVGMGQNPACKKARRTLDQANITHHYLAYGNYFRDWRRRNALKMWTGWPTFPMVFIKGILIGGASDLRALVENNELKKLL